MSTETENQNINDLIEELISVTNDTPGMIGVAFVSDEDTITINNGVHFPMMSVFKLHQSLAVYHSLERKGISSDTVLHISREEVDKETWSPMYKEIGTDEFDISVDELVRYALVSSDNNASNILFKRIIDPDRTYSYLSGIAPDINFSIRFSESEMKKNHKLSYRNYSSPLSCALLIKMIFEENFLTEANQEKIREYLTSTTIGNDRIGAPFNGRSDIQFGHKTGSGYRNENMELSAFNDIGFIRLPDGYCYSLAIMIRDFSGDEKEAAEVMARISGIIYNYVLKTIN